MNAARPTVAVVGAGIAGLCAARALRATGRVDVTVLEASDRPGGVLRSQPADGYLHEHAANGFLAADDGATALAAELGVAVEEASPAARKRWIVTGGALRAVPAGPMELLRTDLLSWRGKLSALAEPLRPARRGGPDESVADFARRRLGPEVARAVLGPVVTGVFAARADELSLRAAFPRLAALEERGGLVRGLLADMLAGARAGRRGARPRMRLCAPVGGVEALVRALAADLGDALRTGAKVDAVRPGAGGGVALELAGGASETFDAVVLATPAHASATLVATLSTELSSVLGAIPYAPVAVVYLGYAREQVRHPLDGFGFLVAEGEPLRILGTVFESVLWSGRAPEGRVLFRCIFGGGRDPDAAALDDDALVACARRDLGAVLGVEGEPEHAAVVRAPRGIAQYTLGHTERVRRAEALAEDRGLVLAGSGYHGVAVNGCVADARRVADRVTGMLAQIAAVLLAVALAAASAACASKSRSPSPPVGRDGGDAAVSAPGLEPSPVPVATGGVAVTVEWPLPPAALLAPRGRNACGVMRPPPVSVHTMGGLRGAVVSLEGVEAAPQAPPVTELAVRGCRIEPSVSAVGGLGGRLALVSDDERRHEVIAWQLGEPKAEALARVPLPLIGQRVELPLDRPGIVRVGDERDGAHVLVADHPWVAVTGDEGRARFSKVPVGTYRVQIWHPPVTEGGPPRVATGEVTVTKGKTARVTVSLAE